MRRITIHEPSPILPPAARPALELREPDALWAVVHPETLEDLHARAAAPADLRPTPPRLVIRSAGPAKAETDDAAAAFASWSNAGWTALEDAVRAIIEPNPTPTLLWPGRGSVLSDAVSTLSFARRHERVGLVIDPVAWITNAMAADAPDHLDRFASALTLCGSIRAVVIRACETGGMPAAQVGAILRPLAERAGSAIGTAEDLPSW